ncbi:unnamed protein product [Cuscuta epithymum]|uniref:Uncharacterized protein n=1 Tax=Cuscuta epithymum TaxID=186058 RepID=A0AAV0EUC1_9ASTE|nr:unnamed protein product [Cuscuta epithymum]
MNPVSIMVTVNGSNLGTTETVNGVEGELASKLHCRRRGVVPHRSGLPVARFHLNSCCTSVVFINGGRERDK